MKKMGRLGGVVAVKAEGSCQRSNLQVHAPAELIKNMQ